MSDIDTTKLRALALAATCDVKSGSHGTLADGSENPEWFISGTGGGMALGLTKPNAQFIAAAANREAILSLLDQLAAAQAECERLRASHALRDEGYASADYQAVAENIANDPRWAVRADSQRVARWALSLRTQLAAVTAARDEACDIADGLYNKDGTPGVFDRISSLRKAGGGR